MRNAILVSIVTLILALAGGYSIIWYFQASSLRIGIKNSIEKLNAKEKYISYDAIEFLGFPSNVYVSIINPHFKGRVDTLLKAMNETMKKGNPQGISPFEKLPEWDEEDKVNGSIVIGVNAMSDTFSFSVHGNWEENSKIGANTISTLHQQTGLSNCILKMEHSEGMLNTMWNYKSLATDGETFVKNFRSADCSNNGGSTIDPSTKDVLASSGPMRMYIKSEGTDNARQVRFFIKSVDMEVTQKGDAMIASYFHALSPEYLYPINFSVYGKQNAEIDFSYSGPANHQQAGDNPLMHVALSKFDLTNNVYNHHMHFLFDNTPEGANQTTQLNFRAESNFSEQYDTLVREALQGFIKQAHDSKAPQFKELQAQFQNYSSDQLYSIIYPALFSFHQLGNVVESVDLGYKGTAGFTTGDIELKDFELSGTPYGFKAIGNAKVENKTPLGGTLDLACINCFNMIDDMVAYMGRVQKTVSYFAQDKAATLAVDPNLVAAVKKFLAVLAAPAKDNNDLTTLRYAIVSDKTTGIAINGKPLNAVMAMVNEYLGPYIKHPAAPEAQPANR